MWADLLDHPKLPPERVRLLIHQGGAGRRLFAIAIQRRLGLYISAAKPANDALATAGERPDWLGDAMCNAGEHSTRHHAVNRAWRDCLAAVAVGPVLLGDKQEADRYKQYNSGHVADLIQPGASAWGTDWLGETKVASPLTAASHAGRGSAANGGTERV